MKFITHWFIYALVIGLTAYLLPGVYVSGLTSLLVLAIVLGAINSFIKPVLLLLTLPLTIFTLGLSVLIINALLVMLAAWIVPGFVVTSFWWALLFSLIISIFGSFAHKFNQ